MRLENGWSWGNRTVLHPTPMCLLSDLRPWSEPIFWVTVGDRSDRK